jgi:hypothetical protein
MYIAPRVLGSRTVVDNLLRNEGLREKMDISLPLPELVERISSLLNVEFKAVRRPSKARSLAEARGFICYLAIRGLGYKDQELGKELRLGRARVSIAVRWEESLMRQRPDFREKVLYQLDK